MLKDDLQKEILVRTKTGAFKLFKDGGLADLPSQDLSVPEDNLMLQETRDKRQETSKLQVPIPRPRDKFQDVRSDRAKPAANFYFSVEDEKEVERIKKESSGDVNKKIKDYILSVVRHIIQLIEETGAATVNVNNRSQLENVIKTRLNNVRTLAETKEALTSALLMRGQPLSRKTAEIVLELIEKKRKTIEEAIKSGETPTVKSGASRKSDARAVDGESLGRRRESLAARAEPWSGAAETERKIFQAEPMARHMTSGPVDELRTLNLKEYRKLGRDPQEAAVKIFDKIGLLEDESLLKKDEGVKAWQQSEVYRVYMQMGMRSMSEKKTVEAVALELKNKGEPFLTPEEFSLVADLNRKLSY